MKYSRTSDAGATADASRAVSYVLSTAQVARDNHTINQAGWVLDNYRANPVLLWCHDSSEPPIGRMSTVAVSAGALRGTVEYADAATYQFADTIYRLVKGGFIHAVSVSWNPVKFSYSTDRSRPGGIDFLEQELLEVSQVPVPCDIGAIATARAAGIDTGPLYAWTGRMLDLGAKAPLTRVHLETLRRNSQTAIQAAGKPTVYDVMVRATSADRLKIARRTAYENAVLFGLEIPRRFRPPQDRVERESIVLGLTHQPLP